MEPRDTRDEAEAEEEVYGNGINRGDHCGDSLGQDILESFHGAEEENDLLQILAKEGLGLVCSTAGSAKRVHGAIGGIVQT